MCAESACYMKLAVACLGRSLVEIVLGVLFRLKVGGGSERDCRGDFKAHIDCVGYSFRGLWSNFLPPFA